MKRAQHDRQSAPMGHRPLGALRRFVAAFAGAVIITLNLIASLLAPPVPLAPQNAVLDPVLAEMIRQTGEAVFICAPSGMLTLGPDGLPIEGAGHGPGCLFCLPLTSGGALAPAQIVVTAHYSTSLCLSLRGQQRVAAIARPGSLRPHPRAPPSFDFPTV